MLLMIIHQLEISQEYSVLLMSQMSFQDSCLKLFKQNLNRNM